MKTLYKIYDYNNKNKNAALHNETYVWRSVFLCFPESPHYQIRVIYYKLYVLYIITTLVDSDGNTIYGEFE